MHTENLLPLMCPSVMASMGPMMNRYCTHIFLSKVDKVLKVNIIPVGFDIAVDEEIELVSNPVFEDKGQDPCRQLQEEDEAKEHGELGWGHTDGRHWIGRSGGSTGKSSPLPLPKTKGAAVSSPYPLFAPLPVLHNGTQRPACARQVLYH